MLKLTKKYNGGKMQKKFLTIIMGMLLLTTPFFHAEENGIKEAIPVLEDFKRVEDLINYITTIKFKGADGQWYTIKSFDNEDRLTKQLTKIFKRDNRKLIVKTQLGAVSDKRAKDFIKFVVGAFRETVVLSDGDGGTVKGIIRFDAHRGSRFAEPNINVECFADMSSLTVTHSQNNVRRVTNNEKRIEGKGVYPKVPPLPDWMLSQTQTISQVESHTEEFVSGAQDDSYVTGGTSKSKRSRGDDIEDVEFDQKNADEAQLGVEDTFDEEEVSSDEELKGDTDSIIDCVFKKIISTEFGDEMVLDVDDDEAFQTDLRNKIKTLCKRKNRKTLVQLDTVNISDQDVPNVKRLARGVYKLAVPFTQDGKKMEGFLILKGISNNIFKKQKAGISYQFFINSGVYEFEGARNIAIKSVKIMNYNRNSEKSVAAKVDMIYTKLLESNPILEAICSKNSEDEKLIKNKLEDEKLIKNKLIELLKKKTYKYVKFPTLSRKSKLNSDEKGLLVLTDDRITVTKFKSKKGKSTIELSFKDLADGNKIKYVYLSFANGWNKTLKIRIHKNKEFAKGDKSVNNDENDDQDTGR